MTLHSIGAMQTRGGWSKLGFFILALSEMALALVEEFSSPKNC